VPARESRAEYARRMHAVQEHVDAHLDRALELDELAAVAHFSAFHFHRLFSAYMGETLGEYVRRRRLELGALRLVSQPELPVLNVALAVGFGSPEAFARAFKARFGQTPSAWRSAERAKRKPGQAKRKRDQAGAARARNPGLQRNAAQEAPMKAKLVDRKPVHVAYFRHVGPTGTELSEFWRDEVAPWMETNGLFGRTRYGVSHDDPGITAPEQTRYDACVEIPDGFTGTGKYLTTTIPGGRYAVARFEGRADQIGEAWASLLRDWLPKSGMQLDARPFFEHYPPTGHFDPKTGVFDCELCIPVAPL
jgi:AraC family transcriptional regulator